MFENMILRTPLVAHHTQDHGCNIYLKAENLQSFGSYKIRGVATAIAASDKNKLKHGLMAISAGNMAQSVAFVAKKLNLPCKIFIPTTAPEIKKLAIKNLGAQIIELPFLKIWEMVKDGKLADHPGLLIHPVLTKGILQGYGDIAKEIIEDLPEVDAIVIPFGVGGLTLGMVKIIKELKPHVSIYTCEPSTASPLAASLKMGRAMKIERIPSFIDAIGTPQVLEYVYEGLKDSIAGSIVVSPEEAMMSIKNVLLKNKLFCEGAAGVSVAAALKLAQDGKYKNIACVLSGGNMSPELVL